MPSSSGLYWAFAYNSCLQCMQSMRRESAYCTTYARSEMAYTASCS